MEKADCPAGAPLSKTHTCCCLAVRRRRPLKLQVENGSRRLEIKEFGADSSPDMNVLFDVLSL